MWNKQKSRGVLLALAVVVALLASLWLLNSAPSASITGPQDTTTTTTVKPVTANRDIGFASREKLVQHYKKHGREFGQISMDEYLRQAQDLRDRPAGGAVLEKVRTDRVITRFDRDSGAFLAFNQNLIIRTYFKPNDGEAYFHRQAQSGRR